MSEWLATRQELDGDFALMVAAHRAYSAHYNAVAEGEAWLQAGAMAGAAREAGDVEQWNAMQRLGAALAQALDFRAGADANAARVAFHDTDQEAVKILIPTPREVFKLMAGGYTRRKRVIGECPVTGFPVMEGTNALLGPMSHDEAIQYLIWKALPRGCNHYQVITTDDLPRIEGCTAKGRVFRAAWRLGDGISVHMPAAREAARAMTRAARAERFKALDDLRSKALDEEDGELRAKVKSKAQKLKDAPADPRIDEANTPAELLAAVETIISEFDNTDGALGDTSHYQTAT